MVQPRFATYSLSAPSCAFVSCEPVLTLKYSPARFDFCIVAPSSWVTSPPEGKGPTQVLTSLPRLQALGLRRSPPSPRGISVPPIRPNVLHRIDFKNPLRLRSVARTIRFFGDSERPLKVEALTPAP